MLTALLQTAHFPVPGQKREAFQNRKTGLTMDLFVKKITFFTTLGDGNSNRRVSRKDNGEGFRYWEEAYIYNACLVLIRNEYEHSYRQLHASDLLQCH